MKRLICLLGLLGLQNAAAAVIDFEGVGEIGGGSSEFAVPQGYGVTTDGPFRFFSVYDEGNCPASGYEGSAPDAPFLCASSVLDDAFAEFSRVDDAPFSISQLDVYAVDPVDEDLGLGPSPVWTESVLLQAWDAENNLLNELAVNAADGLGWRTVLLGAGWTGIDRFRVTSQEKLCGCEIFPGAIMDNLHVNVVPPPPPLWLFGSGLAALWLRRRPGAIRH